MERQTDRQRNEYTRFAWAGGTFFQVVLLCCVSVWFLREQGFWSTVCLLGTRFWWLRPEKKKDKVVCLAGCAVVSVFGSGGKLAFFCSSGIFFCSGGKFWLRPEKKKIQSSVWRVHDHYYDRKKKIHHYYDRKKKIQSCIKSTWSKPNTNPLVQLQYIHYI